MVTADNNGAKGNTAYEIMRFITPVLLSITLAVVANINIKIDRLDDKVFKHLTNDEIHAPRSQFVYTTQFDLYQKMRDKQIESNEKTIQEIKVMFASMERCLREKK